MDKMILLILFSLMTVSCQKVNHNPVPDLFTAVEHRNLKEVQAALRNHEDPDQRNDSGSTPLFIACRNGDLAIAEELIRAGASVHSQNHFKETPLFYATAHYRVAMLLLNHQADPRVMTADGKSVFTLAARDGNSELVTKLLEYQTALEWSRRDEGLCLTWAIINGHGEAARLIIENGADVNLGTEGVTPLMAACETGSMEIIRLIIEKGGLVNAVSDRGFTALAYANGNPEVIRYLLTQNAAVNPPQDGVTTALMTSMSSFESVQMLLAAGADVQRRDEIGKNVLMFADDNTETVKLVLDAGAEINLTTAYSWTPLILALARGYFKTAGLLIDRGGRVNTANRDGETPLMMASGRYLDKFIGNSGVSEADRCTIIRKLLDKNADLNAVNSGGYNALDLALMSDYTEVVKLLKEYGAVESFNPKNTVSPGL